jgi:RNA polymerase sigma-70 factor (ECF subfamily)
MEDAELARRIAAGDRDAEGALCERVVPRVRAYGLRHLRDEASASDLAQHVAVVLIEALRSGRVEDPERLAAFVSGACRNTVLAWKRGERTKHMLLERFGATFPSIVDTPNPVDRDKLAGCLAKLESRDVTIVVATYFDERTSLDIARELETTEGNVRVARHRALAKLHECLTKGDAS